MYFKADRRAKQTSWRRQVLEMLCGLLVLIWFGNPNFHSFCHLVNLGHQHPTGSVFSHSHTQDLPNAALADNGDAAERLTESDPASPYRQPGDSEAPILHMHLLETEVCCSAPYAVLLDLALPALDEPNFIRTGFFSSAELGTIGARGPPIFMATRYLQLI